MNELYLEFKSTSKNDGSGTRDVKLTTNTEDPRDTVVLCCELLLMAMNIEKQNSNKDKDQIFKECFNHLAYFLEEETHTEISLNIIDRNEEVVENISEN